MGDSMSAFRTLSVIYLNDEAYEAVVNAIDETIDMIRRSGMDALIRMEIDRFEISIRGDKKLDKLMEEIKRKLRESLGRLIEKGDVVIEED